MCGDGAVPEYKLPEISVHCPTKSRETRRNAFTGSSRETSVYFDKSVRARVFRARYAAAGLAVPGDADRLEPAARTHPPNTVPRGGVERLT